MSASAEILREPAFDPAEFELLREAFLANVEARRSNVEERVENAVNRHVYRGYDESHVFYAPTFEELIARNKAVTVEQARDFWASFYGPEGGTVSIVGDFDPDEIVPVVPPIYPIYRRNLGILHHHRIPFPACIRSSKSSRTARHSTQKSLPCDSR